MTKSSQQRIADAVPKAVLFLNGQYGAFEKKQISRVFPAQGFIFQSVALTKDAPPYVFSPVGALALALMADRDQLEWSPEFRIAEVFEELKKHPHAITKVWLLVFKPMGIALEFCRLLIEQEARFLAQAQRYPEEAFEAGVQFIEALAPQLVAA